MNKRSPQLLKVKSYQQFHPPPGSHRTSDKWKLFSGNSMKNNHPAHFSSHFCKKKEKVLLSCQNLSNVLHIMLAWLVFLAGEVSIVPHLCANF